MTNYNSNISISERTHERKDFAKFAVYLAFQNGEKKRSSFLCSSDMLIATVFHLRSEFLLENVWFISKSGHKLM